MNIQSATATLPFRATQRPAENTPPCQQEPQDPGDNFEPGGNWKEAALTVGRSALRGAIEGIGWNYLAYLAEAAGGPAIGLAAKVGILGVGAAIGVKEDSAFFEQVTGSATLGKVMGGVRGAGKHFLYLGSSPVNSLEGAIARGAMMGGMLGVLDAAGQANHR